MKAIRFHQHGGPEVLKYEDAPEPKIGERDVLLHVKAASINHIDMWLRRGMRSVKIPLPHIPGSDASGVIEDVGSEVKDLKKGQRVLVNPGFFCGRCEFCYEGSGSLCVEYDIMGEGGDGSDAEFVKVPCKNIIPIPDNMTFEEAAAVPLVFLTAWRMLVTKAKVKASDDVLILGAGAGVGTACIQIAKLFGARVFVTASSEAKLEKAKELGADILINYVKEDFSKRVRELTNKRGVDVVVDYIGKDTWQKSLHSLRKGGRLVTCGATTGYDPQEDVRYIFFRQLEILGSTMGSAKEMADVLKCVFAGKLKPVIYRVMPLKDTAEAHKLIEGRVPFGKIVLRVS
ncbi:MAG: alcohol dehydrogenase [Planctomycetes bacterium RBG_16_43_13]|nr:MAG: alcohol dehydrogenase [Planctomycetes bacterium RBG_16_43_13]